MGITTDLVTMALNAATLRQQVAAHNIANANTPSYVPYKASFEGQLDQLQIKLRQGENIGPSDLSVLKMRVGAASLGNGLAPTVALDMEAAKLSETVLQYQAIVKAYSQMTSLLSYAINEGRR